MKLQRPSVEIAGAALTAARYPIAEVMARRVRNNQPIGMLMAAAVATDIWDGQILRALSGETQLDTPLRRIVDGTIDHMTVLRVAYEVALKNPDSRPYIGVIASRAALAAAGLNGAHLLKTGEVTKGRKYQKATHLTTALFGLVAASEYGKQHPALTHATGLIAASVAVATAPAHLRGLGNKHDGEYRLL